MKILKLMNKKIFFTLLASACLTCSLDARDIKGSVKDSDGKPVEGVVVSDGVSVTLSDKKGKFTLDAAPDSKHVFISTPSGYISSATQGEGSFYQLLEEGRKKYDFTLTVNPKDDTRHRVMVIADPQISDADEFPQLRENVKTIIEEANETPEDVYTFGLCLGDIVGWNHALYPEYNEIMSAAGIDWRNVIGNHDMTNYGRSFETSTSDYEKMFGPAYYSFNVGDVHYIVLNDNFFVGKDWYYIGYLPEDQLKWMEKDLAFVPKDKKVVACLHIPTTLREWDRSGYNFNYNQIADIMCNKKAVYDILEPYQNSLILSGHIHTGNNEIISDNLMEHNITSLGGAWYCGPICIDGSPAGFKVYDFNGTDVEWRFRGSNEAKDHQIKVYANNPVYPGEVVVNVFDYDPEWKVEYFEDGVKVCDMSRFEGKDPLAMELYKDPSSLKRGWVCAILTQNLLRAPMGENASEREVRVTDRFGRVFSEKF